MKSRIGAAGQGQSGLAERAQGRGSGEKGHRVPGGGSRAGASLMSNRDPVKGRVPTAPAVGQGDQLPSPVPQLTPHSLGAHPERGPPSARAKGLSDTSDTQILQVQDFRISCPWKARAGR